MPLYGDGGNVRDWLFVKDNCSGIDAVLQKGEPGEIYNIGGGNCLSNIYVNEKILGEVGLGKDKIKIIKKDIVKI